MIRALQIVGASVLCAFAVACVILLRPDKNLGPDWLAILAIYSAPFGLLISPLAVVCVRHRDLALSTAISFSTAVAAILPPAWAESRFAVSEIFVWELGASFLGAVAGLLYCRFNLPELPQ